MHPHLGPTALASGTLSQHTSRSSQMASLTVRSSRFAGARVATRSVRAAKPTARTVQAMAFKVTLKTPSGDKTIEVSPDTYILDAAEVRQRGGGEPPSHGIPKATVHRRSGSGRARAQQRCRAPLHRTRRRSSGRASLRRAISSRHLILKASARRSPAIHWQHSAVDRGDAGARNSHARSMARRDATFPAPSSRSPGGSERAYSAPSTTGSHKSSCLTLTSLRIK